MTDYRTLKTQTGLALEVSAETGGKAITLTTLVIGDGGGSPVFPDARQNSLIHEITRVPLNTVTQKPNDATQWVAEAVIPAENGGYTVREVGLLTSEDELFAVGNFPEVYKPHPDEGTAGQLIVTMNFQAQNANNITLSIDGNSAVATRQWVQNELENSVEKIEGQAVSGTLELSKGDQQGLGLHTQGSDQSVLYKDSGNGWRPLALQSTVTSLDSAKLNRAGDTASGNLVYQSDVGTSPWASTPQTVFRFKNSKALGSVFGQIIGDDSFQTLLYSQNVDGINKAWGFRSNDGHVATPNNHTLLEVDDAGDGHVIAQNIGSATGKKLATTDDNAALEASKLNRAGDTSTGNLTFDSGNAYQNWAASPQTIYRIGGGLMSLWGQIDGAGNMQLVLGGNNPGQPYALPWVFNPTRKTAATPSGNNILETGNIAAPRMRQCFRVFVANGAGISWPKTYARDSEVTVSFTPTDNGNGQVHIANILVGSTPDRSGCRIALATINKNNSGRILAETDPIAVDVTVEGYTT